MEEAKLIRSLIRILVVLPVAVSLVVPTTLQAQAVYGSISGTVYDPSGAAVPNAAVTITDLNRDVVYTTTTNDTGAYKQTHLIIGSYRLKVEATGFSTYVQDGIGVSVDTVTTADATLKTGDITQTVDVKEDATLLKTERTDVSTTLTERSIKDLPNLNRNFTEFLLLTPGAIQFNWNDTSTENPQGGIAVNVNGQHFTGVGYILDGTDNRDFMTRSRSSRSRN